MFIRLTWPLPLPLAAPFMMITSVAVPPLEVRIRIESTVGACLGRLLTAALGAAAPPPPAAPTREGAVVATDGAGSPPPVVAACQAALATASEHLAAGNLVA